MEPEDARELIDELAKCARLLQAIGILIARSSVKGVWRTKETEALFANSTSDFLYEELIP